MTSGQKLIVYDSSNNVPLTDLVQQLTCQVKSYEFGIIYLIASMFCECYDYSGDQALHAASCLACAMQRKLSLVTLAVEIGFTFCDEFFKSLQVAARDCNVVFLNHCKLQPEIATCNTSPEICNAFYFPTLRDRLQGKLHHVTLA